MDVVREWSKEVIRGGTKGELMSEEQLLTFSRDADQVLLSLYDSRVTLLRQFHNLILQLLDGAGSNRTL